MKFAKQLETDTENLPDELRQHLIRYKYLKKAISKIVDEMKQRGLSATLLSEWLRKSNEDAEGEDEDSLKIEYFFVGKYPPDIRTCIKITYQENDPQIQQLLEPTKVEGNDHESLVIELEQDDEFFQMLMRELNQVTYVQEEAKNKFEKDVHDLESKLNTLVFQGNHELDRSVRSAEKSRRQMEWFTAQLLRLNLVPKIRSKESKQAYEQFLMLNAELINIRQFQAMNQLAMVKILKKHDKRSGLNASSTFPDLASTNTLFNNKLAKMLYASVTEKLVTIVPQPDDYSCPICMNIAWRPIRLVCGHVFCVRCLIKQQKKHMPNCPVCRHKDAVRLAGADQLDVQLENTIATYFPKEIKEKRKENELEQAIEDVQAMTGRVYSPEQLQRMQSENHRGCIIM
ncbi:SPX domain-containing protein [Umbelopsis sp. PMI_123]|nr:SPX domain-containing protein [Umbelopsis sp. PMI_123]